MCSNQNTSNRTIYIACTIIFIGLFIVSLSLFILKEESKPGDYTEFKTLMIKEIESLKEKLKICRGNKSLQRTNHLESDKPELRFRAFKLSDFRKHGNYLLANAEGIYGIVMPVQGFR